MVDLQWAAKTITVKHRHAAGTDKYNHDTYSWTEENVYPVLVAPAEDNSPVTLTDSNRLESHMHRYTLYFPKDYKTDLDGAKVLIEGQWFDVLDATGNYDVSPNDYGRTVRVGVVHG